MACGVGYAALHATEILSMAAQKSDKWYVVLITTADIILPVIQVYMWANRS
ncbi:MAG: hypothetical protein WCA51_00865 [Dehalococcoidia bacterium]